MWLVARRGCFPNSVEKRELFESVQGDGLQDGEDGGGGCNEWMESGGGGGSAKTKVSLH